MLGAPNTDYFNLWILAIEGDSGVPNPGTIDAAVQLGTSDARGLITTRYLTNQLENGTITLLSLPFNPSRSWEDRLRPFVRSTGLGSERTPRVDPRVPCGVSDARR